MNTRGSKWGRWDLHFHTPSSFDYKGATLSPADSVDKLVDAGIEVVAITDHHVMDTGRIKAWQEAGEGRLRVFPGIELRAEIGTPSVHYIMIFPHQGDDVADLWTVVSGRLGLTEKEVARRGGDERVYVPLRDAHAVCKDLGGVVTVHAGKKTNSIEGIRSREQFQQQIKFDVTRDYVDVLEIGQLKDVLSYVDIVFPVTRLERPLIIGSDSHDLDSYVPPPTWMCAEPTFLGLRQVINEPARVYLGTEPPSLRMVEKKPTRFIDSIEIFPNNGAGVPGWFDHVKVEFNTGLVSIIGRQGSGKSALADVIGLLGNSPHEGSFAFLNGSHFRHAKSGLADSFSARLTWRDGSIVEKCLADRVPAGAREAVRYLPQFYLDQVCDEVEGGQGGRFEDELKRVIFSRVPAEERAGMTTLDELIAFRTADVGERMRVQRRRLSDLAAEFVHLDAQAKPSYQVSLQQRVSALEAELEAHDTARPVDVPPPGEAGTTDPRDADRALVSRLTSEIDVIQSQIAKNRELLTQTNTNLERSRRVRAAIQIYREELGELAARHSRDLAALGLEIAELVTVSLNEGPLDRIDESLTERRVGLRATLSNDKDVSLTVALAERKQAMEVAQARLTEPDRAYAAYQSAIAEWSARREQIVGDEGTPDSLIELRSRVAALGTHADAVASVVGEMMTCSVAIFEQKNKILAVTSELHAPVRDFASSHPIVGEDFGLDFSVQALPRDFVERFLNFIHQNRRGSFYGADALAKLEKLVRSSELATEDGLRAFLAAVIELLTQDDRTGDRTFVDEQLRREFSPAEIIEFLFGLEYLEPGYGLRWNGRALDGLSPGERGTLLLVFYLLVDDADIPLVIDQPEGNLDNQVVFELLVKCIRDAKARRQIVIVTHNPNLAVLCDSEQIIVASLDKAQDSRVAYMSGALEDPRVGLPLVNVLEGTRPAIVGRSRMYEVIFED